MSSQFHLTTLGEVMLRFSVPAGRRIETTETFDVIPGGAESNLSTLLARLGRRTAWCGGLPDNPLGRMAANHMRLAGVDLAGVAWNKNGRMGNYFVEFSAPPRSIQVLYDRADSVAAKMQAEDVHWDHLLNTRLLHLTGITPALSPNCLALTQTAIQRARQAQIPLSFDINYRAKLWSEKAAAEALLPLIQGIDLLFCGQGDAARLFACRGEPEQVIEQLAAQTQAQRIVVSFGDSGAVAWDGARYFRAPAPTVQIIDRLGAGDALAAGVIHGWLDGDMEVGLRYGVMLAALALSQFGDIVITNQEELTALLAASGGGIAR